MLRLLENSKKEVQRLCLIPFEFISKIEDMNLILTEKLDAIIERLDVLILQGPDITIGEPLADFIQEYAE